HLERIENRFRSCPPRSPPTAQVPELVHKSRMVKAICWHPARMGATPRIDPVVQSRGSADRRVIQSVVFRGWKRRPKTRASDSVPRSVVGHRRERFADKKNGHLLG